MAAQETEDGGKGPGTVAEFDAPSTLLRANGLFAEMVAACGLNPSDEIKKLEAAPGGSLGGGSGGCSSLSSRATSHSSSSFDNEASPPT